MKPHMMMIEVQRREVGDVITVRTRMGNTASLRFPENTLRDPVLARIVGDAAYFADWGKEDHEACEFARQALQPPAVAEAFHKLARCRQRQISYQREAKRLLKAAGQETA